MNLFNNRSRKSVLEMLNSIATICPTCNQPILYYCIEPDCLKKGLICPCTTHTPTSYHYLHQFTNVLPFFHENFKHSYSETTEKLESLRAEMEAQLADIEEKIRLLIDNSQLLREAILSVEKEIQRSTEIFMVSIIEMEERFSKYSEGDKISLETMIGKLNLVLEEVFKSFRHDRLL